MAASYDQGHIHLGLFFADFSVLRIRRNFSIFVISDPQTMEMSNSILSFMYWYPKLLILWAHHRIWTARLWSCPQSRCRFKFWGNTNPDYASRLSEREYNIPNCMLLSRSFSKSVFLIWRICVNPWLWRMHMSTCKLLSLFMVVLFSRRSRKKRISSGATTSSSSVASYSSTSIIQTQC